MRALQTKKGRAEHGLCLVEGTKFVRDAKPWVEFTFGVDDTPLFEELVTTETPQEIAAVARLPHATVFDLEKMPTILLCDGVQDPGNVGAILRLCAAFNAGCIFVHCADITAPKVVRSSAGALFTIPWMILPPKEALTFVACLKRPVFRLESPKAGGTMQEISRLPSVPLVLVVGSEGRGITLPLEGETMTIPQQSATESLNVTHAVAIALYTRYTLSRNGV